MGLLCWSLHSNHPVILWVMAGARIQHPPPHPPLARSLLFVMSWGDENSLTLHRQASMRQLHKPYSLGLTNCLPSFPLKPPRMGWRDGSMGKDACRLEFNPLDSHRRGDVCMLSLDLHVQTVMHALTHTDTCMC